MVIKRYVNSDDKSHKFWQIEYDVTPGDYIRPFQIQSGKENTDLNALGRQYPVKDDSQGEHAEGQQYPEDPLGTKRLKEV